MLRAIIGALLLVLSLVVPAFGLAQNPTKNPNSQWMTTAKAWAQTAIAPLQWFFSAPTRHGTLVVEGLPPGWTFEIMGVSKDKGPLFAPQTGNFVLLPHGEYTLAVKGVFSGETLEATVTVETNKVKTWTFPPDALSGEEDLRRDGWGWIMTGGGAALAGGGALLGLRSKQCVKKVKELSVGPDKGAYEDELFGCQFTQVGANVGMGAGTALVIAGIYALLTNGATTTKGGVQVTPSGITYHFY